MRNFAVTWLSNIALFNPKGIIALKERNLMIVAVLLMLVIVVPVLSLLFAFAWKYRSGNAKAEYSPDTERKVHVMLLWWLLPAMIILILSIVNWHSTHDLDPYKPIVSDVKPITIQVVALDWKWLFIYPEQGIATVNFLEIPEGTPVNFELTADGPMNSFWIPHLGGQMYAMPGMTTQLHLIADETGDFPGSAAEINGSGFAGMKFDTMSVPKYEFETWAESMKSGSKVLTFDDYKVLARPSENNHVALYSSVDQNLYNEVMAQFMAPMASTSQKMQQNTPSMSGMDMNKANY